MINSFLKRFRADKKVAPDNELDCYVFDNANMDVALMDSSKYQFVNNECGESVRLNDDVLFVVPRNCLNVADLFEQNRSSFIPGKWALVTKCGRKKQFDSMRAGVIYAEEELSLEEDDYFIDYI